MNAPTERFSEKQSPAAQVLMIPVDQIDTLPQVRTKFNEATIQELAADIAARGLMQPVTVRENGNRYTLLIGERRFRAVQMGGGTHIAAIVATVEEARILEIQLAENVQREALAARDLVNAVMVMWGRSKNLAQVATQCGKSKAWVSKRLQIGLKAGPLTIELLESPKGTDTELVYYFSKLEAADYPAALDMLPHVLAGELGKVEVKEAIMQATHDHLEDGKPPTDHQGDDDADPIATPPEFQPLHILRRCLEAIEGLAQEGAEFTRPHKGKPQGDKMLTLLGAIIETARSGLEATK